MPIQITVLNRLGDVVLAYGFGAFEIGERACDAQHFVVGASAEAQAINRILEERFSTLRENAEFAGGACIEVSVARERATVPNTLDVANALHSLSHFGAS